MLEGKSNLPLVINRTPWDSKVLGLESGELVIAESFEHNREEAYTAIQNAILTSGMGFVSCRVESSRTELVRVLRDSGFRHIENLLTLANSAVSGFQEASPSHMTPRIVDSGPEIRDIARSLRGLFSSGRFHCDPRIPNQAADRRYFNWIVAGQKSAKHKLMLMENRAGKAVGFFFYEQTEDRVDWLLNGVFKEFQGMGLSKWVWSAAVSAHARAGVSRIKTRVSAQNKPALKLYPRLGFETTKTESTFHFFTDSEPERSQN